MKQEDKEFVESIINDSTWLLYGDLDETFDEFLKKVFAHDLSEYGFHTIEMSEDFSTAYWLLISEFNRLNIIEYGTSPRSAWLTEKGERFKKIVMENENAILETNEYIYKKYN